MQQDIRKRLSEFCNSIPDIRNPYSRCWIFASSKAIRNFFPNCATSLIPEVMVRESQVLVERLAEMTRNRHRKFANTVFHLEPNVKDGPGGYLDYITARWLAVISAMEKKHGWPDAADLFFAGVRQGDGCRARISCVGALLSAFSAISATTMC